MQARRREADSKLVNSRGQATGKAHARDADREHGAKVDDETQNRNQVPNICGHVCHLITQDRTPCGKKTAPLCDCTRDSLLQ